MSTKRTRYSPQFKFQLALEAAKGLKTINALASEHGVHPTQVSEWKRQPLTRKETSSGDVSHGNLKTAA